MSLAQGETRVPVTVAQPASRVMTRLAAWLRPHWTVIVVLLVMVATALIVPVTAPVATTDDWAYARSAQILLHEGRLTIFPVVAATAVFQIVWGALFGVLLGPTFAAFRISTLVITLLGAVALYALCLEMGVTRERGALGVATFLANPLLFVLAYTFMTDAHFVALLVIATWFFVRAMGSDFAARWVIAGSCLAGLAFLTRQQGALIVPAVCLFLLLTRRLRADRQSGKLLAQLFLPCLLIMAGYYLWLRTDGAPQVQSAFLREALAEGWQGTWFLFWRLTFVELLYLGFFTLPLMAALAPHVRELTRRITRPGWVVAALWAGLAIGGVAISWRHGALMPYVAQFFGRGGLGAPDLLGSRPVLLTAEVRALLTLVCLGASLLLGLVAAGAVGSAATPERGRAALVLSIGLGQVAGVLPPSYHYLGWAAGSLDRYLLPLLPLTIALALWGLREVTISRLLGWVVVVALLLFSVAGTRDYLVFMQAIWTVGDRAVAAGVPLEKLDAGSAWDGYYLYERGLEQPIKPRTPKGRPWWTSFYAPATDSTFVVASKPLPGYSVVERYPVDAWLRRQPTTLYLLRRYGALWPPLGAPRLVWPEHAEEKP